LANVNIYLFIHWQLSIYCYIFVGKYIYIIDYFSVLNPRPIPYKNNMGLSEKYLPQRHRRRTKEIFMQNLIFIAPLCDFFAFVVKNFYFSDSPCWF